MSESIHSKDPLSKRRGSRTEGHNNFYSHHDGNDEEGKHFWLRSSPTLILSPTLSPKQNTMLSSCSLHIIRSSRRINNVPSNLSFKGAIRNLTLQEWHIMDLLNSHGIRTPECRVASTPEEAKAAADALGLNKRTYRLTPIHSSGPYCCTYSQAKCHPYLHD
jgi:hypothetical protein